MLGVIALFRYESKDVPEVLRALSRFVGHPDYQRQFQPHLNLARSRHSMRMHTYSAQFSSLAEAKSLPA